MTTKCQHCHRQSQPGITCERWLPVAGLEGFDEVSDHGRVRSLDRIITVNGRNGTYQRTHKGRILAQASHPLGYRYITIAGGNKILRNAKVHHLVLNAFVGPCPAGMECRHDNGNPSDNRLENLSWDTKSANQLDRIRHGTHNNANKTHCKRGHEFTPDNTRILTNPAGARRCLTCQRAQYKPRPRTHPYKKDAIR